MFKNKILLACSFLALLSLAGCKQKFEMPSFDDDPYNVGAQPRTSKSGVEDAGDIDFSVKAPSIVQADEQFYVEYVLKDAEGSAFSSPDFGDDFILLGGPSVSHSSSVQIINGHASSSSTASYTFALQAKKEGCFDLPAATIEVEGRTIKSKPAKVNVGAGGGSGSSTAAGNGSGASADDDDDPKYNDPLVTPSMAGPAKDKLFFTVEATKRKVFEQEPIVLTYKVHALHNLGLANVMLKQKPDLKGFWSQEVKLKGNIQPQPEERGGKLYGAGPCLKYVVFPQQTGKLTVPSVAFECQIRRQMTGALDPFEEFFNGGGGAPQIVQRATDAMDIEVLPLPDRPAGFSGGVGHFTVATQLLTPQPKTNDVVTLRLTVSGVGNLSLVKAPRIAFPDDFDSYDAKMTDKTQVTEEGITGDVIFDYTFVPQNVGKYDIPAAEFIYFDTEKGEYVTLRTEPVHLDVKKGQRSREDVEAEMAMRNSDIRDAVLGAPSVVTTEGLGASALWIGSPLYFVCLLVIIVAFTLLTILLRRRAALVADVAGSRNRQARKKANKHLRAAEKALAAGDQRSGNPDKNAFYSALAQALRGYFADKLTRDAAALTNESILAALAERGLSEELLGQTKTLLEDCDFARFAPAQEAGQREKDLERASELLNHIDQNIK